MTTEVEVKAKEMGWSPKEEFRGDPEKWVDAETFVKRGEEVLPILKANNRRLQERIAQTDKKLEETNKLLASATDAIEALKATTSKAALDTVRQQEVQLKGALKAAREADDVDQELDISARLQETRTAIKEAEKEASKPKVETPTPPTPENPNDPTKHPEWKSWIADNSWFGKDKRKTAVALAAATELREGGDTSEGRAFFDKITDEVDKVFNPSKTTRETPSKVEGTTGGGGGGSGRGKTYADLPAEAKQACMNVANRVVGPGRAHKSTEEWQKAYAAKYFEE